jgi:DNA-binding MarR family transcriptional regulator
MVKERGQRLPALPAGVPAGGRYETANLLHSAALRLLRTVRTVDTNLDLDGPRASLLSVLVFAGPLPVTKLAELEQVSAPAITKTVTALESAGLARRVRSASDGRVVLVSATSAGRRLLERGRAARVRAVAALLDDATDEQLSTVRDAAELIAERLPVAPDVSRARPPRPAP